MTNYLLWRKSFYGSCRSEPFALRYFAKRCSETFCKIHVKHLCHSLFFNKAVGYWAKTPFLWNISWRLLLADILLKSYLERFWKIPKKTPFKKSCFNNVADSIPETLQKHNLNEDVLLQILKIFQNNSSLKNFVRLPLDGVYLFCKNSSSKYVQNFRKSMWLI